jgi:hypothetical protein
MDFRLFGFWTGSGSILTKGMRRIDFVRRYHHLLMAMLILTKWPSSSFWAIGTLVGVAVLMGGISRIMIASSITTLSDYGSFPEGLATSWRQ